MIKMDDLNLQGKRVILREDFNVPIAQGKILSDAKLRAAIPTLRQLIEKNASVLILSHLGRPTPGIEDPLYSLAPIALALGSLLEYPVEFERKRWEKKEIPKNKITLAENVRFLRGEEENDPTLAKQMAELADVFVMDAFAAAHRAHASTVGIAQYAKLAAAGPLLLQEISALNHILKSPKRPCVAIVGGSKVSTKITVLKSLLQHVDTLILGGGIANTALAALSIPTGSSLVEAQSFHDVHDLFKAATARGVKILLPIDGLVANAAKEESQSRCIDLQGKDPTEIHPDEMILDIGPKTLETYREVIIRAKTILWNGPLGVFEIDRFSKGTEALAQMIANSTAYSVAGGGETLAAIERYNLTRNFSHLSTGGGAFLEYIEAGTLPAISMLEQRGGAPTA